MWALSVRVMYLTLNMTIYLLLSQGDEADLAKKIATLKWHEKEMEVCVCNNFHFKALI